MLVLAFDLGNSALKGALVGPGDAVSHAFRVAHDAPSAAADLRRLLAALPRADAVVLASVVPARTDGVASAVTSVLGLAPLVVHAGSRWPFTIAYATPATLGVDRLAAVCGALDFDAGPSRPLVVVDAGTAVTVEAVTAAGVYLGGAIAPGPALMAASLARGTAQLPPLDLPGPSQERLPPAIGRSTAEAIRSGVLHLFTHGVAELVEATRRDLSPEAPDAVRVVTTGGWAPLLAAAVPTLADVRPHLVLVGLARLARREALASG